MPPVSEKPRKRKPQKKASPNKRNRANIMDELSSLHAACMSMLQNTARFAQLLTNKELVDAGDMEQIRDSSTILSNDMLRFRNQLDKIQASTPKKINPNNPTDVMAGLNVGAEYNNWQETYNRAMTPTIDRLSRLLEEASQNLEQQKSLENEKEETPDE